MRMVRTEDATLEKIQANVAEAIRPLEACILAKGILLENVSVYTTTIDLEHGLGRRVRGVQVMKANCDVRVYVPTEHPLAERLVTLQATANAVVTLWVC